MGKNPTATVNTLKSKTRINRIAAERLSAKKTEVESPGISTDECPEKVDGISIIPNDASGNLHYHGCFLAIIRKLGTADAISQDLSRQSVLGNYFKPHYPEKIRLKGQTKNLLDAQSFRLLLIRHRILSDSVLY